MKAMNRAVVIAVLIAMSPSTSRQQMPGWGALLCTGDTELHPSFEWRRSMSESRDETPEAEGHARDGHCRGHRQARSHVGRSSSTTTAHPRISTTRLTAMKCSTAARHTKA